MKEITRIDFNWHQVGGVDDPHGMGEDYHDHTVGEKGVKSIKEHPAAGEGDKWYYDVEFDDGKCERIFNPNRVYFQPTN